MNHLINFFQFFYQLHLTDIDTGFTGLLVEKRAKQKCQHTIEGMGFNLLVSPVAYGKPATKFS